VRTQFGGNNGGDAQIYEKLFVIIIIKSIKIPVYFIYAINSDKNIEENENNIRRYDNILLCIYNNIINNIIS
jgi:hypothetical protein